MMQTLNLSRPTNFQRLKFDELADAANNGDGIAAYMCAHIADNGLGITPVDEVLAVDWAVHGMGMEGDGGILCQAWLGIKLASISLGLHPDAPELIKPTIRPLQRMARENNLHAQTMMGLLLHNGLNSVHANYEAARDYISISAKLGHPEALLYMALMFDGNVFPPDKNREYDCFKRAAERQLAPAQTQVAIMHQKFKPNRNAEKKWLEAAAAQQFPLAMQLLGEWHYTNKTISGEPNPNLPEAFKFWHAAADKGVTWAAQRVAECYEKGSFSYIKTEDNGKTVNGSMAEAYRIYSGILSQDGSHVYRRKLPDDQRRVMLVHHQRIEHKAERFMHDGVEHLRWPGQEVTAPRYKFG